MLNHNKLAQICINCFNSLPKTGKPNSQQWTVLSCIVQQNTSVCDSFQVVSLGTGSKCIGRSKMSAKGDILNDSHAEVVCRRAFLRYLMDQMKPNSEIFIFDSKFSKYKLKEDIAFHFFTSKVPCGDASIFSKQDANDFGTTVLEQLERSSVSEWSTVSSDNNAKRLKLDDDVFRTGAKCLSNESRQDLHLSGCEYHTVRAVRTKPGRGDPTLSVSCSDKIAKWCHLGWQGGNLCLLINEPIFIKSFIIAGETPYSENALKRAIFGRLVEYEPNGKLQQVDFLQTTVSFEFCQNESKQPCPSSIAWCKTDVLPLEVAVEGKKQGVTKKNLNTKAGRLKITKIELFRSCLKIMESLKIKEFKEVNVNEISYCELKDMSKEYKNKWNRLKSAFKIWTIKEVGLLKFKVD